LATAAGDETFLGGSVTAPYFTAVRDALDRWQQGKAPPVGVDALVPVVRLIDRAYELAGGLPRRRSSAASREQRTRQRRRPISPAAWCRSGSRRSVPSCSESI